MTPFIGEFRENSLFPEVKRCALRVGAEPGCAKYYSDIHGDHTNGKLNTHTCSFTYDAPVITDRYVSYDGVTEVLHEQFFLCAGHG